MRRRIDPLAAEIKMSNSIDGLQNRTIQFVTDLNHLEPLLELDDEVDVVLHDKTFEVTLESIGVVYRASYGTIAKFTVKGRITGMRLSGETELESAVREDG